MFKGVEHFAIASPDSNRLAQWYCDNLEFRIILSQNGAFLLRGLNGSVIEVIPSEGSAAPIGMKDPGMRHIAIEVDDFDAAHARLKQLGVAGLAEPFYNGANRIVFFADADGNLVHLIYRGTPLLP
jgi:glyoxylase I family protein